MYFHLGAARKYLRQRFHRKIKKFTLWQAEHDQHKFSNLRGACEEICSYVCSSFVFGYQIVLLYLLLGLLRWVHISVGISLPYTSYILIFPCSIYSNISISLSPNLSLNIFIVRSISNHLFKNIKVSHEITFFLILSEKMQSHI